MIVKTLRRRLLFAAMTGLSMLAVTAATAQTDDGDGDEGPHQKAAATEFEPSAAWMADETLRQRRLIESLRTSASPRDWAIASQIFVMPDNASNDVDAAVAEMKKRHAETAELLRTAALAAPDDALVQWLALFEMPSTGSGCMSSKAPRERVDAVMRLEPDNGLALLPALNDAYQAKDATAIDTLLAQMAAAKHYDDHIVELTLALIDVAARHRDAVPVAPADAPTTLADDDLVFISASAQGAIFGASLHDVAKVCDARQVDVDLRRYAACADIGRRVSRESPGLQLRLAGFEVLRKSGQFDAEDAAAEREMHWLIAQSIAVLQGESAEAVVPVIRRAWLEHHDDFAAARAALAHAGIAPTPPAGWTPPHSRSNAVETHHEASH
jgi:hypothetical protein